MIIIDYFIVGLFVIKTIEYMRIMETQTFKRFIVATIIWPVILIWAIAPSIKSNDK